MTVAYLYDFGDAWHHTIIYEGHWALRKNGPCPRLIGDGGDCPPEDIGGIPAFLDMIESQGAGSWREFMEGNGYPGERFDPHAFDPEAVRFTNPRERLWPTLFYDAVSVPKKYGRYL